MSSLIAIGTPSSGRRSPAPRRRSASTASRARRLGAQQAKGVERVLGRLDALDRRFDQLDRAQLPGREQLSLAGEPRSLPGAGSSVGLAQVSETPGARIAIFQRPSTRRRASVGSQACSMRALLGAVGAQGQAPAGEGDVTGPSQDQLCDLDLGSAGDHLGEDRGDLGAPVHGGAVGGDHAAFPREAGRRGVEVAAAERGDEGVEGVLGRAPARSRRPAQLPGGRRRHFRTWQDLMKTPLRKVLSLKVASTRACRCPVSQRALT